MNILVVHGAMITLLLVVGAFAFGLLSALRKQDGTSDVALSALIPAFLVVFALTFIWGGLWNINNESSTAWLTTIVAWYKGYRFYYPPDSGPEICTTYGPLSYLAYVPAALGTTPDAAVSIGAVLSRIFLYSPLAYVCLRQGVDSQKTTGTCTMRLGIFGAVVCAGYFLPSIDFALTNLHADAPALLFASFSVILLTGEKLDNKKLLVSAILAAVAVWTKQVTFPMVFGVITYLWLAHGLKPAVKWGSFCLLTSFSFVLFFSLWTPTRLWFHCIIEIPAKHPWVGSAPYALARELRESLGLGLMVIVLVSTAALMKIESCRLDWSQIKSTFAKSDWHLFVFVALALLPSGPLGRVKGGGNYNAHSYFHYFLLLALSSLLKEHAFPLMPDRLLRAFPARSICVVLMALGVTAQTIIIIHRSRAIELEGIISFKPALDFASSHREEVYFPNNALITLYSEGKLYHLELGVLDRCLAGFPPTPAHYRDGLPARIKYVILPHAESINAMARAPITFFNLRQFSLKTNISGLERFDVFIQSGP